MIHIAGQPVSPESLGMYLGTIERNILGGMGESRALYAYETPRELEFELQVRKNTLSAAEGLNQSGAVFAVFEQSRCNPVFWIREPNGGFRQRPDVAPSEAVRDIYANGRLYAFECTTAIIIVLYHAVLQSVGIEAFNRHFRQLYLYSWEHDRDLGLDTRRRADYLPGDCMYINNPAHDPAHPGWQGENVVVMGGGLYYGHGIGIRPLEEMISMLNGLRVPGAAQSAYLMEQATRPAYKHLARIAGAIRGVSAQVGDQMYLQWPWDEGA